MSRGIYSIGTMASNVCTVLETPASTGSNRHGTNILVVKGTAHRRLKGIRAKATVITLASFDVARKKQGRQVKQ